MTADEATERRAALIAALEREGVLRDASVRATMLTVPRHRFLPHEPLDRAYANAAVATKFAGAVSISSASQPSMVAIMLEQLRVAPGMRVLEIGAGTGYNAALLRVLAGPAGHVTTVDIDEDITDAARRQLASIGITDVDVITGDGAAGYLPNAPYDRVILTVNAGDIAPTWVEQMEAGGVLVLPLSIGPAQFSIAFTKNDDVLRATGMQPCGFMPLRGSMGDGETGSLTVIPAPGLTMMLKNADADRAGAIAALLHTPPTSRAIPGLTEGWFSALALALSDPHQHHIFASISSDESQFGFVGHGYGIFDPEAKGGIVLLLSPALDGTADTTTRVYGDPATADWLGETIAAWFAHGTPRPQDYDVTALPLDATAPLQPGAHVVAIPHWRLVFAGKPTPRPPP